MTDTEQKIMIDGHEYLLSSLSDEAKAQITNLRVVENEIAQLKARLAIASTAKMAYQNALKNALPVDTH
ncbi:DUF6447 family protein [Nitrosomonas aestuarii]|uniref:Uncharacterized protein n=1 Tax=Nitrosomonas aestuarii TaxID=52441 RepID=A0A1I4CCY4_9PROT|nr:DUF6447 family protein [Nitrosomonas aestuarii]PTN12118.1 hypothetical protein C8R11_10579 [Nitrosomonas aestuarii]SFK79024.1 hypothetical protein SAMN05216302_101557 [Nitrosomonas aestuarii]